MASRIVVIEEPCPNCGQAGLYCELCNGYGVLSRRVLDPGSFVRVWWCKDCGLAAEYRSDLACPHADALPEMLLIPTEDALAGGGS